MKNSVFGVALIALPVLASASLTPGVYVANGLSKTIMIFDQTGSPVSSVSQGSNPWGTMVGIAKGPNDTILLTNGSLGQIQQYDSSLNYIGVWATTPYTNIRGIARRRDGTYLLSTVQQVGDQTTPFLSWVDRYDANGNRLGLFANVDNPYGVIELRNGHVLVSTAITYSTINGVLRTPQVEEFDANGNFVQHFVSNLPFSYQIHECANGNILIASFSPPGSGGSEGTEVIETSPSGMIVNRYQDSKPQGFRGVCELADGSIFAGDGIILYHFQRGSGNVFTKVDYGGSSSFRMFLNTNFPVPISGTITHGNFSYVNPAQVPTKIQIYPAGTTATPAQESTVNIGSSGAFSVVTTLRGSYDIYASASHWLRSKVGTFTIDDWGVTTSSTLINGDVDGNNAVNINDYAILSDAFNTTPSDAAYDARADLDGNGAININDYAILSDNFNLTGV